MLPAGHKGAAVEEAEIVLETPRKTGPDGKRAVVEVECLPRTRLRVHGKLFTTGGQQMRINGVTYGPFPSNAAGEPFPSPERVRQDFAMMRVTGINSIRTYHLPPEWLMDVADEEGIGLLIDVPWRKHLCFLDCDAAQKEARQVISEAASRGRGRASVLAYSIGNEIPPDVVRWHGAGRVERFLFELRDAAKQADPDSLVTYANYPPTEYLELPFLDFATFNVYLHDREAFRRYLVRIQNLVGDRPLVLGELGIDTLREGELRQADFLSGHLREATLMGIAGAYIFSWTDEWHTGGHAIENWAFGITDRDRIPKASIHALRELFQSSPREMLPATPRVSVIVCSHNGARTLEQCLRSLRELEYPDYEVIVVNDGSTDETRAILSKFPSISVLHQDHSGLSAARNAGLVAASGSIVAYTDSDCYADPNWLTHLVHQFQRTDAAAVGGPNLTPKDGWLPGCVAASPGQPMHVLESDQVAEHIPGCNMAFRREALTAINGFDIQFRKAGDDVDVCWRLQQAGYWITFAPGAFVWHHRRQNPRAYLRQQAGYGEAEALLWFKHPDRFNGRGDGKWRGNLYGASSQGLRVDGAIIYRGVFSTGMFQCLYQPGPAHWAMLPSTLEWSLATLGVAVASFHWPFLWIAAAAMLVCSLLVAAMQAGQARLAADHEGLPSRALLTLLCYLQPLVRSWSRYRTRFLSIRTPLTKPGPDCSHRAHDLTLTGHQSADYWTDEGCRRVDLLGAVITHLNEHRWGKTIDSGWQEWDLEIHCDSWTILRVCTVQEDHGGMRRLIRVRFRLRTSGYTKLLACGAAVAAPIAGIFYFWPAALAAGLLLGACLMVWLRGVYRARRAVAIFDVVARGLNLVRCDGDRARRGTGP
jgi:GT2 family glycosyltransferase